MSRKSKFETLVGSLRLHMYGPTKPLGIEFGEAGACIYVIVSRNPVTRTKEIQPEVVADYDKDGRLVGFEVIGALSKPMVEVPGSLALKQTKQVSEAKRWELVEA
ncbi:MAG: DUF2283 domain-containing protein [Planctomycetes bacterium]|nr:DUF2283 domain-containing protein [Planctomycetota bacterium]